MTHSKLVTRFAWTSDYSSRGGVRIDSIGHHHAASTSLEGTLSLFQPGGRTVSPNYCIKDRNIVAVVSEEFRAWTTGSAQDDARSITYEIVNDSTGPEWRISDASYESVIALDADISARYGVKFVHGVPGYWEHRNIYEWFRRSYVTACAGPGFDIGYVIDGARSKASTAGGGSTIVPAGAQGGLLMIHMVGVGVANQNLFAVFGPGFWEEFVGASAAQNFINQIGGTPASSLPVTEAFWYHCKSAALIGKF